MSRQANPILPPVTNEPVISQPTLPVVKKAIRLHVTVLISFRTDLLGPRAAATGPGPGWLEPAWPRVGFDVIVATALLPS